MTSWRLLSSKYWLIPLLSYTHLSLPSSPSSSDPCPPHVLAEMSKVPRLAQTGKALTPGDIQGSGAGSSLEGFERRLHTWCHTAHSEKK